MLMKLTNRQRFSSKLRLMIGCIAVVLPLVPALAYLGASRLQLRLLLGGYHSVLSTIVISLYLLLYLLSFSQSLQLGIDSRTRVAHSLRATNITLSSPKSLPVSALFHHIAVPVIVATLPQPGQHILHVALLRENNEQRHSIDKV